MVDLPEFDDLVQPVALLAFEGWNDAGDAATDSIRYLAAQGNALWVSYEFGLYRLSHYCAVDKEANPQRTHDYGMGNYNACCEGFVAYLLFD